jgi:DNA-binding response OmpR family regulator
MNGRDLFQVLRASRPKLKVLFTSGYAPDAIARRGVLEEGFAYVPKPFSPNDLAAKVRYVLSTG